MSLTFAKKILVGLVIECLIKVRIILWVWNIACHNIRKQKRNRIKFFGYSFIQNGNTLTDNFDIYLESKIKKELGSTHRNDDNYRFLPVRKKK